MYFLFWYFNFWDKKKNTEYIIEMRDAAYILRDAGQSSQFRDCPAKCGTGGHPNDQIWSFVVTKPKKTTLWCIEVMSERSNELNAHEHHHNVQRNFLQAVLVLGACVSLSGGVSQNHRVCAGGEGVLINISNK